MRLIQQIALLTFNEEFNQDVEQLRLKFIGDPAVIEKMSGKQVMKLIENQKNLILKLCEKYNISTKYSRQVLGFVVGQRWPNDVNPEATIDFSNGKYSIEIDEDTTYASLKKAFDLIKKKLNPTKRRQKPYGTFARDYLIAIASNKGKTVAEIAQELETIYGPDEDAKLYGLIPKKESSFRKRFNLPKVTKLKTKKIHK